MKLLMLVVVSLTILNCVLIHVKGIVLNRQEFDAISTNVTTLKEAYARVCKEMEVDITTLQEPFENYLLIKRANPIYRDEDLFVISKYLVRLFEYDAFRRLTDGEKECLKATMSQMPNSFINALMSKQVCIQNRAYNGEYLHVISDDHKHKVRAVTLHPSFRHYLKRSQNWRLTNMKQLDNSINSVGLSNDAFQEHFHSSYLYNPAEDWEDRNEAFLFIGLTAPRPYFTAWLMHPKGNGFTIVNEFTEQYLCAGGVNDIHTWKYRTVFVVSLKSKHFDMSKCIWEISNCTNNYVRYLN